LCERQKDWQVEGVMVGEEVEREERMRGFVSEKQER
jgi:hypothetical protein